MSELPSEVEVLVEVPRGARVKRRHDGSVDFVSPFRCPFNYGSVPGRLAADGDPLDAVVLGPRLPPGSRETWGVHGVIRFIDAGVVDDKLICGARAPAAREIRQVRRFFRRYGWIKALLGVARRASGPTSYLGWEPR